MKFSIAYVTGRTEPRWSWFIDSFVAQTTPEQRADIQVIFIDGKLWANAPMPQNGATSINLSHPFYHDPKRRYDLELAVNKRFPFLHIPPKPCLKQGPFRKTSRDFFCASNTRNTAIIAAEHPYLLCVDDLSVLCPGWVSQAAHAVEHGYCACGAYKKVKELVVENGSLVAYEEFAAGIDSRWDRGNAGGIVPWSGGGLYGCSFGAPTEAMLNIDGFEPACNGDGGEDTDMGIRLERSGVKIFYNRNMLTLESEEDHYAETPMPRERRIVAKENLPPRYESYQKRNEAEKYYSDHVLLNRLVNETERIVPILPEGLRAMRTEFLSTGMVPIPQGPALDWRDNTPLELL